MKGATTPGCLRLGLLIFSTPQIGAEAMAREDGDDVSAHIAAWGLWEAGWTPPLYNGASSMEALLGIFCHSPGGLFARFKLTGKIVASELLAGFSCRDGIMIDVGAGTGLFSLAAAAQGLKVMHS